MGNLFSWFNCPAPVTIDSPPSSPSFTSIPSSSQYAPVVHRHPPPQTRAYAYTRPPAPPSQDRTYTQTCSQVPPPQTHAYVRPRAPAPQTRTRTQTHPPVFFAMPLSKTMVSWCCVPSCKRRARVYCGRCLRSAYCSSDHSANHTSCPNAVADLAENVLFYPDNMMLKLNPKHGSGRDPYTLFYARYRARFRCKNNHRWMSSKAGFDINLRALAVTKIYSQKCRQCKGDAQPQFEDHAEEILTKYFRWMRDLESDDDDDYEPGERPVTDPHIHHLHEKCDYGRKPHDR